MKICRNLTFLSRLRQISRLKVVVISYFWYLTTSSLEEKVVAIRENLRSATLNRRSKALNVRSKLLNTHSKLLNEDFP